MYEIVFSLIIKNKFHAILFLVALFVVDCTLIFLFFKQSQEISAIHFLDVGQADAELITLDSGANILIDSGGTDGVILNALAHIFPVGTKTIDLIFISHPETDHMGGIRSLIGTYHIGAVVYSGKDGTGETWKRTKEDLMSHHIPIVSLMKNDRIITGDSQFDILSPDDTLLKKREINESSLVIKFSERGVRTLFTGDMGKVAETYMKNSPDVFADILKVAHHGSKYSSSDLFLNTVYPHIAVIEVGKNSYGHPTQDALLRLSNIGAEIFRTDINGTISLELLGNGKISVFKSK